MYIYTYIHTHTYCIDKCTEWTLPLYIVHLDFKKALDGPGRLSLHKTLADAGVPEDYTNLPTNIIPTNIARLKLFG